VVFIIEIPFLMSSVYAQFVFYDSGMFSSEMDARIRVMQLKFWISSLVGRIFSNRCILE